MEIPDAVLEARVAEAEEKASFSFMKKNDHHFDEHFTFDAVFWEPYNFDRQFAIK